ncbi:hypothetical protein QMK33_05995 [Hymenobacter sp. H14-R3]|uniref:hypothetical protein n=1 Tax=Hymenobacter sp. H14-R3 TaxID=3046308 RepID=UPI0024B939CF|nr:hypothetical protein [Hymenobacter sp. H14-R3]MDJ0364698.1 hypothetical protein [Hymenobacter sp. H14-R3]
MNPLNQPERRTRLWQFSLLYLLALLIPLGASYYLFSNKSIVEENTRLTSELDVTHKEQARLVMQFDTLTHRLQNIDQLDQRILSETNQQVKSSLALRNEENVNAIGLGLSELKRDSAQMKVQAHRQLARNILRDFDLLRSTRKTVDVLNQNVTRGGDAEKSNATLLDQLGQARQQVIMLQAALANCSKAPPPIVNPPSVATLSTSAKLQIELLRNQVAFADADCLRQRALDRKPHSKDRAKMLEESRTAFIHILQNPATDDLKQSIEKTLETINVELGKPARFFLFK